MPIAVFAKKSFQVSSKQVYTFSELSISSALQTEKQDVDGKKPSTYIKGPDLDTMSFNIPLNASFGVDVRAEFDSWMAIKDAKVAYPFILGGKPVGPYKWLLTSVALNNARVDHKGRLISGVLQLQFDEFVRKGSKSSNEANTSAPAISAANQDALVASLIEGDKQSSKRTNPNANYAVAAGIMTPTKQQRLML